jgi:hypothetical protein
MNTPDTIALVVDDSGQVTLPPLRLAVQALRGVVPTLPKRETTDFDEQIEEAMDEEADRIVDEMEG